MTNSERLSSAALSFDEKWVGRDAVGVKIAVQQDAVS